MGYGEIKLFLVLRNSFFLYICGGLKINVMAEQIIGRLAEKNILKECYESDKAEFIAVYGRRRIGKTFLIKSYFKDNFDFYITGIYQGSKKEQLSFFNKQLCDYSKVPYPQVDNWFDAFDQLKHYLSTKKQKSVVFYWCPLNHSVCSKK